MSCPSLNAELLESELFGHARGSFTGAVADTEGKVEAAEGGSLFLDEIGDLPLLLQPKLLRFLQERRYERVGETRTRTADVRLIAASNRDLEAAVAAGPFREDLLFRLNVVELTLPPLRAAIRPDRSSPSTCWRSSPDSSARRSKDSRPRRARPCSSTPGRATSASCETRSNAPSSSPPGPSLGLGDLPSRVAAAGQGTVSGTSRPDRSRPTRAPRSARDRAHPAHPADGRPPSTTPHASWESTPAPSIASASNSGSDVHFARSSRPRFVQFAMLREPASEDDGRSYMALNSVVLVRRREADRAAGAARRVAGSSAGIPR